MSNSLVFIAHNIRSTHNVGSLFRTANGLGVDAIYCTGYTPYPKQLNDQRLPHIAEKLEKNIQKTALGAQHSVPWSYNESIEDALQELRSAGYTIAGLEQTSTSIPLPSYEPPAKLALLLGSEVTGIDTGLLASLDVTLEIPMVGTKESFNVTEAATMAMYHCKVVHSTVV